MGPRLKYPPVYGGLVGHGFKYPPVSADPVGHGFKYPPVCTGPVNHGFRYRPVCAGHVGHGFKYPPVCTGPVCHGFKYPLVCVDPRHLGYPKKLALDRGMNTSTVTLKPRRLGPLGMLFNQIGFRTPLQRVPPEKCPAPLQYRCQGCFYVGHPTLATPLPPSNRLLTCQRRRAVPAEPTLNGVLDRGPIRHRGFRFCSFCLRAKTLDQEQIVFVVITTHPVHWFYSKRTVFETGTWSYTEYYGMSSGAICKTSTGFNV